MSFSSNFWDGSYRWFRDTQCVVTTPSSAGADASYQRTNEVSYETGLAINGMAECSRPSSPWSQSVQCAQRPPFFIFSLRGDDPEDHRVSIQHVLACRIRENEIVRVKIGSRNKRLVMCISSKNHATSS